jgi:DNA-binding MarR family transcriptional regulator
MLTDTQLVILSAASQRNDGSVQPLPKSLKLQGGAVTATLRSLLARKLIAEQPTTRDAPVWRQVAGGDRLMLVVTDAGRDAIRAESEEKSKPSEQPRSRKARSRNRRPQAKKAAPNSRTVSRTAARAGTKLGLLVDLLRRRQGATVPEVVKATGWQPHSVRGAISGTLKKKLGLRGTSEKIEGRGRVYRAIAGR